MRMLAKEREAPSCPLPPEVGDKIYVFGVGKMESNCLLQGGVTTVTAVLNKKIGRDIVKIVEAGDIKSAHNWDYLGPLQDHLRQEYGNRKAVIIRR